VVQHGDRHASERDAGPEQEREKVRAEELRGSEESADRADSERSYTND
jgi:hypothetical protein